MAIVQATIGALEAEPHEVRTDEVQNMKAMVIHLVSCVEDLQECVGFALGQLAEVVHRSTGHGQDLDRQSEKHQHPTDLPFKMHEVLLQQHDKQIHDIQAMLARLRSSFAYFACQDEHASTCGDITVYDDFASRVASLSSECAVDASAMLADLNINARPPEVQLSERGTASSPSPLVFADNCEDCMRSQDVLNQVDEANCSCHPLDVDEKPQPIISFSSPLDAQLGGYISWQDDAVILAQL